jgi:hypothetical protein
MFIVIKTTKVTIGTVYDHIRYCDVGALSSFKAKVEFRPGNNSYLFSHSSSGKTFLHYLSDVYTREFVFFFALWPLLFVVSTTDIGNIDDWNLIPFYIVHHRAYNEVSYQK